MTMLSVATAAYLVAALLFIMSLAGLSKHETAKQGIWFGISGMAIALAATIATLGGFGAGGAAGGTTIKAGGAIFALGQDGMEIIVASAPTSPFKGKVALDDTDLKSIVTTAYETWKVNRVAALKRQFEPKQIAAAHPGKSAGGSSGGGGDGKPEKDKDGAFPILLASMKSGEVTEIKPDNIKKWGDAVREKVEHGSAADGWVLESFDMGEQLVMAGLQESDFAELVGFDHFL